MENENAQQHRKALNTKRSENALYFFKQKTNTENFFDEKYA